MNSIILSNITYRYPLTDFDALHDVSFCFEEGKFYGVIGPNGAGKTTLCSLVKGLIPGFFQGELTGDVQILGKRMESWDESELTSRVGYIFQNPFTQISGVKDTVFEEIAIGLENLRMPKEEIIARVVDIVRLIGIEDLIELNPNELSGGQRQRVAFASILAMDCDIYVIDEPTSQLDPGWHGKGVPNYFRPEGPEEDCYSGRAQNRSSGPICGRDSCNGKGGCSKKRPYCRGIVRPLAAGTRSSSASDSAVCARYGCGGQSPAWHTHHAGSGTAPCA